VEPSRWHPVLPLVLATTTSQALLVVLAPIIVAVGEDLGAPVATVGQARSVTAVVAIAVSLVLTSRPGRWAVPRLLHTGAWLAVAACAVVAAAGSVATFLAAHIVVGLAFALLLSGSFAGLGAFDGGRRAWAAGQVAGANALAWVVVNPVAAALAGWWSWRAAQAAPAVLAVGTVLLARRALPVEGRSAPVDSVPVGSVPMASVPLGSLPVASVPAGRWTALTDPHARRWVLAETAGYTAWTSLLTFAGAYLIERTGSGASTVGWQLAAGAAAYLVTSSRSARLAALAPARRLVAGAAVAMGLAIPVMFAVATTQAAAVATFCLLGLCAGIRTPASARLGLEQLPDRPAAMMAARTGATQLGYLLGAVAGGVLIAVAGYAALGVVLGVVMLFSAVAVLGVREGPAGSSRL